MNEIRDWEDLVRFVAREYENVYTCGDQGDLAEALREYAYQLFEQEANEFGQCPICLHEN